MRNPTRKAALQLEVLEDRACPSAWYTPGDSIAHRVVDGTLEVRGTARSETLFVEFRGNQVLVNGRTAAQRSEVQRVVLYGNGGHDWFAVHDPRRGFSGFASQDIDYRSWSEEQFAAIPWHRGNGQAVFEGSFSEPGTGQATFRWGVFVNRFAARARFPEQTPALPLPDPTQYDVLIFHDPGVPFRRNLWIAQVGDTRGPLTRQPFTFGLEDETDPEERQAIDDLMTAIRNDQKQQRKQQALRVRPPKPSLSGAALRAVAPVKAKV